MADIVKTQKAGKKKSSRRLKRSVRRTLGALFLVSALVVAAIPTEGLQAAPEDGVAATAAVTRSFDSSIFSRMQAVFFALHGRIILL